MPVANRERPSRRPIMGLAALLLLPLILISGPSSGTRGRTASRAGADVSTTTATSPLPGAGPGPWRTVFWDHFLGARGPRIGTGWDVYSGHQLGIAEDVAWDATLSGKGQLVLTGRESRGRWLGAEVATKASFAPEPGQTMIVESRLSLPAGEGYWPAFWALAQPARHNTAIEPTAGEIDMAETIDTKPWAAQFFHCGPSNQFGPCAPYRPASDFYPLPGADKSGQHTYAWLWHNAGPASSMAFFVDGTRRLVVTEQEIGAKYWNAAFDHPYFLIYDVAIGGGYPGMPGPYSPEVRSMIVQWVKVLMSGESQHAGTGGSGLAATVRR